MAREHCRIDRVGGRHLLPPPRLDHRIYHAERPKTGSLKIATSIPLYARDCHANISETYARTGMGRSFSRPTTSNTVGSLTKPVTFYHKASDSYFTMTERDGRFYQRRYQIGFDGKETNSFEKEIHFVMGSGNHVRAFLHRTSRNTLVELPLAWYAENGGFVGDESRLRPSGSSGLHTGRHLRLHVLSQRHSADIAGEQRTRR